MSAAVINVLEAKTHFSRLLESVAAGQEVIIGKHGKPVAKLVPYQQKVPARKLGTLRGQCWEAPDAWEIDPEILESTYLVHLIKAPPSVLPASRKAR